MRRGLLLLLVCALAVFAAWWSQRGTLSDQRAEDLVREYNRCVIEAFRQADPMRVESITSPAEAKKLTGLVGAKSDMGLTMDAQLLDLQVLSVEREPPALRVLTAERWRYADRRMGDGSVQGAPSTDSYRMVYHLAQIDGRWVVDRIAFAAEPVVGRAATLAVQPPGIAHGKSRPADPKGSEKKP